MVSSEFIRKFTDIAKAPSPDLATVALLIARLEYPKLDASEYLTNWTGWVKSLTSASHGARISSTP